jgi:hypothetical protein
MANVARVDAELSCEVALDRLVGATHERDAVGGGGLHWVAGVVHVRGLIVGARVRVGASVGLRIVRLRLAVAAPERADWCVSCSM